ncbi:TMEM165/GDT1 family protein [Algiphilus sp.]|uniref:TMEM165/GDT1 family protein n=1 Tax=Algiphilus sp. TaxID=1872431 RepID=UPI003B5208E4
MEAFALSAVLIALAEIGDKSQLIALALAARFRRRVAVAGGIALAALASHALAGVVGVWLASHVADGMLRIIIAVGFFGMALWMLWPEADDADTPPETPGLARSALLATLVLFFVAELGDKTQLATVGLAARFEDASLAVIGGSALGMTLVNVPVIWLGHRYATRLPVQMLHRVSAALLAVLGLLTLWLG